MAISRIPSEYTPPPVADWSITNGLLAKAEEGYSLRILLILLLRGEALPLRFRRLATLLPMLVFGDGFELRDMPSADVFILNLSGGGDPGHHSKSTRRCTEFNLSYLRLLMLHCLCGSIECTLYYGFTKR